MTREEHIENLKAIASDMPSDKCSDWIESLMAGINAMEELKQHREAWEKVVAEIEQEYNRLRVTRSDETLELGECLGLKMSMKIIDKYKAEGSEE